MTNRFARIVTACISLVLASRAPAQVAEPAAARAERVAAAVGRMTIGDDVMLQSTGQELRGTLRRSVGDSIVVGVGTTEVRTPMSQVNALFVRGNEAGHGAIVGGIVGGVVFGLGGLALEQGLCENANGCSAAGAVIGFGALGAGAGALVGAGIGVLVTRWERVFP